MPLAVCNGYSEFKKFQYNVCISKHSPLRYLKRPPTYIYMSYNFIYIYEITVCDLWIDVQSMLGVTGLWKKAFYS